MKIFPVFHNSLLRPKTDDLINEAESRNIRGRILERDDETEEVVEKWEFEALIIKRGYTTSSNGGTTSQHDSPLPI
jgi:hypothetical protein